MPQQKKTSKKTPEEQSKINQKISETKAENFQEILPKLKDAAGQGMRPKKQYKYAGIPERTYYNWRNKYPEVWQELDQILMNYRRAKIKESALIGAPMSEQRRHANDLTEKEYDDIMNADPDFYEEVESARLNNLKLWARKNIADSIQNKGNVHDSWRYLEHMDDEMNKRKIEISDPLDKEDAALLKEYHEKVRQNIDKKIDSLKLADEE